MDFHRGKTDTIEKIIEKLYKAQIKENRECFEPLVDTIKLFGPQSILSRVHRDRLKYLHEPIFKITLEAIWNP